MSRNKNNKSIWRNRIKGNISSIFKKVGGSLEVDKRLYKEDVSVSLAHVEMLAKQKIISIKIRDKIIWGLKRIENEIKKKKFNFKIDHEDIHMSIENRLKELIGEDAGYVHTARSRNDQVVTDLKIWLKNSTKEIIKSITYTQKIILKIAEKNIETIMPGYTHLKIAQPISLAHYLLAFIEMFERDKKRFNNNIENLLENPLGVAAISGTSFNIDRFYTTRKLKFKIPTRNSLDTVADRDFVIDFLYTSSICALHISRLAEEFIIWNSDAYNLITLNDKVVTGSSIMPQKKNPDPLEFLRGKTGNAYGNLFSMMTIVKALPLSYFKDLQDDKKFVFESFDNLKYSLLILNDILNNIIINKKKMYKSAEKGYITATDLADYLVKKYNYPFRKAYEITGKVVNYAERLKKNLDQLSLEELIKIEPKLNNEVLSIFNLKNSINSKKSYGGTSFENIKKMINKYKKEIK